MRKLQLLFFATMLEQGLVIYVIDALVGLELYKVCLGPKGCSSLFPTYIMLLPVYYYAICLLLYYLIL